ncbi:MAG TPA: PilZ domain-containing protein [Holophagaceae bacterium]|nr:PilZ domain-containing protein [Holophagaceae bacterium]
MSTDQRKDARRLALGPGFSIRFVVQGRTLETPLLNLSYGGCFTLVPFRDARHFERGVAIADIQLLHGGHPKGLIQGQVAYTLGGTSGMEHMDQVGTGVQFTEMDGVTRMALQSWLDGEWAKQGQ